MKKTVSLLLVFLLCVSCCVCVSADEIQPRWKVLSFLGVDLLRYQGIYNNAELNTTAKCGSHSVRIDVTITITRWNGSEYVDTSTAWTDSGYGMVGVNKKFHLSEGNYVARVDVTLYDANGAYIETVTSYSEQLVI